jgi:2-amino-4-hydroxy-6-hydroxymethyldihydropteridine diphosphokinase
MSGVKVTIGLGSNLANPVEQIQTALKLLATMKASRLLAQSPLYKSQAMLLDGAPAQPDYINAVALLETRLSPRELLQQLHAIEQQQGRERNERWGARTLDLDILTYGDEQIDEPDLQIPHAGIAERNFVLVPLQAMMGDSFEIPGKGNIAELVKQCPPAGLEKLVQGSE